MSLPNLFEEATSELSQDAFFCWLLKWVNLPTHPMASAGRAFLATILRKLAFNVGPADPVTVEPKRQFGRVDIVALVESPATGKLALVIEDKVHAKLSGENQLARNVTRALAERVQWRALEELGEDQFKGVLIKTGYDYDLIPPTGYVKVNFEDLRAWISEIPRSLLSTNAILSDWVACYAERLQHIDSALAAAQVSLERMVVGESGAAKMGASTSATPGSAFDGPWGDPVFEYAICKGLYSIQPSRIFKFEEGGRRTMVWFHPAYDPDYHEHLDVYTNIDGSPSLIYTFQWDAALGYSIYYRLKCRGETPVIQMRYWKQAKNPDEITRVRDLSARLRSLLTERDVAAEQKEVYLDRDESTFLEIILPRSPGLGGFYEAHVAFIPHVRAAFQGG